MKAPAAPRVMSASTRTAQIRLTPSNPEPEFTRDQFVYNVFLSLGFYLRAVLPPSVLEDIYETLQLIEGGAIPAAGFSEGISRLTPPPLTQNYRRRRI